MNQSHFLRWCRAPIGFICAILSLAVDRAEAQAITVLPVSIVLAPGQRAASLTVVNEGDAEISIQVRAFTWAQPEDGDRLTPSDEIITSPPIATIVPHARQIVRLVLHGAPQQRESTYRILLDQIPPPSAPGTVRLALRLSIPIFALPTERVAPKLTSHIEVGAAGATFLVVRNDGARHETLRDITLTLTGGGAIGLAAGASPYVLAGATRRWRLAVQTPLVPGSSVRLKARGETGQLDQQLVVKPAA